MQNKWSELLLSLQNTETNMQNKWSAWLKLKTLINKDKNKK